MDINAMHDVKRSKLQNENDDLFHSRDAQFSHMIYFRFT